MDDYYLSKEDWDAIIELGVDEKKDELVMKKISTATKTALTRKCVITTNYFVACLIITWLNRYNASEHPIPFHKADLGKAPKKLAGGPAPDLEEAYVSILVRTWRWLSPLTRVQVDDVIEDDDEEDTKKKDSEDPTNDSLIKAPKKKKATKAK